MRRDDFELTEKDRHTASFDDFAEQIERHIERTACGRVSDLHVSRSEGVIVLQGRCRTYHAKQLVLEAALEMADGTFGLINELVVS